MHTVCITGMHRSGTSLAMRTINLLGVDLGDREKIIPPGGDNIAGYWEHRDILRVNNALLEQFGGSWDRLPHFPAGWEHHDNLADLRVQALMALESFSDNSDVIGWKDPRLSVLLPFWRSIVSVDRTIVVIRHPAAVAASLQYRNGFTLQHATALWIRYTLEALVNDPGALVLHYSDVLADSESQAQALAKHLRLPEPDASTLEQIRDFVHPALAHQTEQLAPDSPDLRFASKLFEEIVANPDNLDLDRFRALVTGWNEAARSVGDTVTNLQTKLEDQREQIRRTGQQANHLRNELRHERQRVQELDLAAEFEYARRRRLHFELGEARRRTPDVAELRRELRDARQCYNELRNRISVRLALPVAQYVRLFFRGIGWIRERLPRSTTTVEVNDGDGQEHGEQQTSSRGIIGQGRNPQKEETGARPASPPLQHASANGAQWKTNRRNAARTDTLLGALRDAKPVSIIIPIHNAVDDLRRCVESVRSNTTFPAELVLIDDASTDPRVAKCLVELEEINGVRVLRNTENLGFSGTVNRGIRESAGDVVVLNSDTEVTPRWLTNLALAVHEEPTVGSATPISDNAGAFSVPERGKHNATPPHLSRDEVGRLITRTSQRLRPDTPTANGVCMYLKRAMLDTVGLFDEKSFPRGYGEENDFCMRAKKAGWRHIVDDATFIVHVGSMSYGEEKQALLEAGLAKVAELHPEYPKLVQPFLYGPRMHAVRDTVSATYDNAPPHCLPRILHVIHTGGGGVPAFNGDLARGLADRYEHLQLVSDAKSLILKRYEDGQWVDIEQRVLEPPVSLLDHHHGSYRHGVTQILQKYGIEIVHLHSLIHHAHDLPQVADAMGIAVVVTLHDYFLICPTIQLIDDRGRFCGGPCTPGQGQCRTGMNWVASDAPHLKHAWVYEWQRRIAEVLQVTDAMIAPTNAVRQTYLHAYPDFPDGRIKVIEHGEDVPSTRPEVAPPGTGEPIRVLALGNLNEAKGAQVLANVLSLDVDWGKLDLHILGGVAPAYRSLGQQHGDYNREEFPALIAKIDPALVVLLSPWGETFSYTLTEAWACGIPVVAANVGALGERVRTQGGGWVVDPHDPEAVYEAILWAGRDSKVYRQAAAAARAYRPRSVAEMADEYDNLYQDVLAERGPFLQLAVSGASTSREEETS